MKKALVVLMVILVMASPLAAATHKEGPDKNYVGLAVGYNGVRDSLISVLAKVFGEIFAQSITAGLADTNTELLSVNGLALGVDGYFELTSGFSLSSTLGCSLIFDGENGIVPAPFGDLIFYGRLNGGSRGDFLLGSGIGTFCMAGEGMYQGYISLLGAMRYQMDIASNLGWWIDITMGWNALSYNQNGIAFMSDGFSVMPSLRTGISYSF